MMSGNARRGRGQSQRRPPQRIEEEWIPKTELGKKVVRGDITSIDQIFDSGQVILEPEIVNKLLPEIEDEVLDIKRNVRVTDSGNKITWRVSAVVGDKDGHVGFGKGKYKEVPVAINKAIRQAKLNLVRLRRGCGSWECVCGSNHSIPIQISGKQGSSRVTLLPAPKGTGLVAGENAKAVLRLAGIQDVWVRASGKTRTTINFAAAVVDALSNTMKIKVTSKRLEKVGVKE